jgi:hypothetical protein
VGAPGADSADRWAAVLEALLAQETSLARVRAASGDKDAADAIWSAARGAAVEVPVTRRSPER